MTIEDIALTLTPGLGVKRIVRLLEVFSTAENIFRASQHELVHFAEIPLKSAEAIVKRLGFTAAEREIKYCMKHSIIPLASTDQEYPPLLRLSNDYPHVIYVMGNPMALSGRNVSIIGTRRMSPYGDRVCHDVVRDLSSKLPDVCIVSGLAFGVDSAAHRAALHYGATTVAVVANALPAVTPSQHTSLAQDIIKNGGAIVSEYHSQSKQRGSFYIARNRIVAAMSGVTVVVETPLSGGSMSTASFADGYNRLVLAVPARLSDTNSAGCNLLIRNNVAKILLSTDQLIRDMMWDSCAPSDRAVIEPLTQMLTAQQQSIVDCFTSNEPLNIEDICDRCDLSISEINVTLTELELLSVLQKSKGNQYELLSIVRTT